MADDVPALQQLVQQLRTENEQLRTQSGAAVAQADNNQPSTSNFEPNSTVPFDRLLYIPRERKCPMFRGSVGMPVEDWVEEMEATLRTRRLQPVDQAYFIYDHLEGEAKDEIRYRPRADREDPAKIFTVLREMYGCDKSYVSMQQAFFARKQQEGESLQEFSHALYCLMEKVQRSAPRRISDASHLLRDQFVEHVYDPNLRRELKKTVREKPDCTLLDIRTDAIRWEREGRPDEMRSRSYSVPSISAMHYSGSRAASTTTSEFKELRQLLEKQQEQLNTLTQGLLALQSTSRRPVRPVRFNNFVCRRCQQPGHYAKDCDNDRVPPQARPTQPIATTISAQEAGNFFPLM